MPVIRRIRKYNSDFQNAFRLRLLSIQTLLSIPRNKLLSNLNNKEHLILQFAQRFTQEGIITFIAEDDADLLIVQTAIEKCHQQETVIIIGQDVDLLVPITVLSPEDKDVGHLTDAQGNIKARIRERIYSSRDSQCSDVMWWSSITEEIWRISCPYSTTHGQQRKRSQLLERVSK
ncbi:hypothetical protein JTB14_030523 [Gonioctena quinquepunctata]|nr:hypothetical protein JTB14_030523 [Gonioctena quinquepunctata]